MDNFALLEFIIYFFNWPVALKYMWKGLYG